MPASAATRTQSLGMLPPQACPLQCTGVTCIRWTAMGACTGCNLGANTGCNLIFTCMGLVTESRGRTTPSLRRHHSYTHHAFPPTFLSSRHRHLHGPGDLQLGKPLLSRCKLLTVSILQPHTQTAQKETERQHTQTNAQSNAHTQSDTTHATAAAHNRCQSSATINQFGVHPPHPHVQSNASPV